MPASHSAARADAIVFRLSVLIIAHRQVVAWSALAAKSALSVSHDDARKRGQRIVRRSEEQVRELVSLGVTNPGVDLASIDEWPDAGWWAGFRIPQLAYLTRYGKEVPNGVAEMDGLSRRIRDNLSRLNLATQTTAEISACV